MREKRAKDLRRGDILVSSDGRGEEKVLFNRPHVKGRRFVRTSRFDHNWPNDHGVTLVDKEDG